MQRNFRNWVIVTVLLAVITAVGVVKAMQMYVGETRVVAVKTNVTSDEVLTPNDLEWIQIPHGALYSDTVTVPSVAIGMAAKGFIPAGTALRSSMLERGATSVPGKLGLLGNGMMAVAVSDNLATGVAGTLQPGDRVNIYGQPSQKNAAPAELAQNVLVLQGVTDTQNKSTSGLIIAVSGTQLNALLPYLTKNSQMIFVLLPRGGGLG